MWVTYSKKSRIRKQSPAYKGNIIYTQVPVNYEVKNKPRTKEKLGRKMK